MNMSDEHLIVFSTCPDETCARLLADGLVSAKLAACVNILPAVTSVYSWQGKTECASEQLLLIKTREAAYPALEAYLRQHHPYELPEIAAVSLRCGLPGYLHWIDRCLESND